MLKRECPYERTYREKESVVLKKILVENNDNYIVAMPPSGLMDSYWKIIKTDDSLITIALKDISLDIEYFGRSYKKAKVIKDINGKSAGQVADELRDLLFEAEDSPGR